MFAALLGIALCLIAAVIAVYLAAVSVLVLGKPGGGFIAGYALGAIAGAIVVVSAGIYGALRISRWYSH